ncbi:MAG: Fur family transcriptional regulator [Nitrospinota bacterium]
MFPLTGEKPEAVSIIKILRDSNVAVTIQRIKIGQLLFSKRQHLSADEIYDKLIAEDVDISRATVYNTLKLFAKIGCAREVLADPKKLYYEPKTNDHYHCYDVENYALTDIPRDAIAITGLPEQVGDSEVVGLELVVKVKSPAF